MKVHIVRHLSPEIVVGGEHVIRERRINRNRAARIANKALEEGILESGIWNGDADLCEYFMDELELPYSFVLKPNRVKIEAGDSALVARLHKRSNVPEEAEDVHDRLDVAWWLVDVLEAKRRDGKAPTEEIWPLGWSRQEEAAEALP